ncbi:alpha/beta fold hydrolase [Pusillimonas noertemannii]|nr:alpha/beta fold hydrolase [Pusillimonas noertemannii]NYT68026.1 alpha/beta fold hydrolase [Pusillimonas noertemannii]TFL12861.1 alpha/beta fold hydrolase [Pusillimonas noertemannii]
MKISTILISCAAALGLAACGGGSGSSSPTPEPDPLAFYKNQAVSWGDCSRYFVAGNESEGSKYLAKLGDRVQCADIKAPLDYQNPDGLQVSLSMLRVRAAESPEQKPNLFFNPGGPGGDGLMLSLRFALLLSEGNDDSTLGKKYKEVGEANNFVGFSPRGVGASTTIQCTGNELVYPTDDTKWGDTVENIRRLTDIARYTASNCQKNPVSDYINTDATARDMDLMRHLLGDEKLHYYGVSYGTWLGFWYAGVFPDRVGPMVLDSNMNFSKPIHVASISYLEGVMHTFKEYIAPYAARHDDIFNMGTSAQAIVNELNTIGHEVTQALLDTGGSFRAEPGNIPGYLSSVKAAIETQKLLDQGKTLDEIGTTLTNGDPYFADPELNELFIKRAASLVTRIAVLRNPLFYTEPEYFSLDSEGAVWDTVVCNDEPLANKDQVFWVDKGFELSRGLPIAANRVAKQPCLYWDRKANIDKPSMDSLKEAPLLMVQSQFDVPTPLSGALETFDQLPAVSMVRVENEGAHGLMVYQTECVDLTVMNHLLGNAPAQRLTECQGKPLPFDEALPQDETFMARAASSSAQPLSNFEDPQLAQELIDSLRKSIGR